MRLAILIFALLLTAIALADSPQPRILLVRDAHYDPTDQGRVMNEVLAPYYIQALNALGLSYDNCTVVGSEDDGPGYDVVGCIEQRMMKDYDIVIWFTGNDQSAEAEFPTLTTRDREEVAEFLARGGKLFLTGEDVGFDIGATLFYKNDPLLAFYCNDSVLDRTLLGKSGDPISHGFTLINPLDISGGAGNQETPSLIFQNFTFSTRVGKNVQIIKWHPNASAVFAYRSYVDVSYIVCDDQLKYKDWSDGDSDITGLGAIRVDTKGPYGYKHVYFAFGFEGIENTQSCLNQFGRNCREEVMWRIFGYLSAPATKGLRVYAEASQVEGLPYVDLNLTCDPSDAFCLRSQPKLNATCMDYQLFANVSGAEYFINTIGNYGTGVEMQALDGSFNDDEAEEPVQASLTISGLQLPYTLKQHAVYARCNDTDGYWGKFDSHYFTIDRYPPIGIGLEIEGERNYTNDVTPMLSIVYSDIDTFAHFMRFSCNGSAWTSWLPFQSPYEGFDITSTAYGCPAGDGNRTIYVQVMDLAGNFKSDEVGVDWIVLDRLAPQITSVIPANNSYIRSSDLITVTFTLPCSADACAPVHINVSFNGSAYISFYNATPFDHGWRTEGPKNLTIYINDTAGNLNTSLYAYTVDNTPPSVAIDSPVQGGTYSGIIALLTTITDAWSGVDDAWYEVRNASNLTQVFASGLLSPPNYDAMWDSTAVIGANESVIFNVSANDTLGWTTYNVNVSFVVDNRIPSLSIRYPYKIWLNRDFNLDLVAISTASPSVNLSYVYYNISNATWYKVNSSGIINQPSYNFTDFINLSEWCDGRCADGSYSIFFWANNTNGLDASVSAWFGIDTTPPFAEEYKLNVTVDPYFNDRRLFVGEAFSFSVNLSDPRNVSGAWFTVATPLTTFNASLKLIEGTPAKGQWQYELNTSELGTYELLAIYANDTVGNLFLNQSLNLRVLAVNATLHALLNQSSSVDAGQIVILNLTFDFNKTVSAPSLTIYIPPNSPARLNLTPHYSNSTSYNCYFGTGCSVQASYDNQPAPTLLNLTTSGSDHKLMLNATLRASTPSNDTQSTWLVSFRNWLHPSSTQILTPYLRVEAYCDSNAQCTVYQNRAFNLTLNVSNLHTAGIHTGTAHGLLASFENVELAIGYAQHLGNLASGEFVLTYPQQLNITEAGEYEFVLKAEENTGRYGTQATKLITVLDTVPPQVLSVRWGEDNVINVNETIVYDVEVYDNTAVSQVWLTLNQSTGYVANYSLSLYIGTAKHGIWRLSYSNTSWVGNYSVLAIYANDTRNNLRVYQPAGELAWFEVRELDVSLNIVHPTLRVGYEQLLSARVSGNGSAIKSVLAEVIKPRQYVESLELNYSATLANIYPIYEFKGSYGNVSRSGNYEVRLNVTLTSGISKVAQTSFSSPYGNASLLAEGNELYLPIGAGTYGLTWYVVPEDGDLLDVNLTLSIENQTVLNITASESFFRPIGNVYWEEWRESKPMSWQVNITEVGSSSINLNLTSATPSVPIERQNSTKSIVVHVIPADEEAPLILGLNQSLGVLNLKEPNLLWINATDLQTAIKEVWVEVSYPVAGIVNLSASKVLPNRYRLTFYPNETGIYSWRAYACDLANNCNASTTLNFKVADTYCVELSSDHPIYNKGENVRLRVSVKNVNGQAVKGFNLTLKLYKAEPPNVTLVSNEVVEEVFYPIGPFDKPKTDEPATYTAYAEVSKEGNKGEASTSFKVSKVLPTHILYPSEGQYFPTNSPINITVRVLNQRSEVKKDVVVTAYCEYCERYYRGLKWYEPIQAHVAFPAFEAPAKEKFSITAISVDAAKNTDPEGPPPYVGLTTIPPAAPTPAPVPPTCTCKEWQDVGCGYGNCSASEIYQVRSCEPAGCAPEVRCLHHPRCTFAFEFELKPAKLSLAQGESKLITGTLRNLAEFELLINLSITELGCAQCSIQLDKQFVLNPKEERDFSIKVHASLNQSVGSFTAKLRAIGSLHGVEPLRIEKELQIEVTIQPERLFLQRLQKELEELKQVVQAYQRAGLKVDEVVELLQQARQALQQAELSIRMDELAGLREANERADALLRDVKARLFALWLRKWLLEHKWLLIACMIAALLAAYLIGQVVLPYYRLGKEIKRLQAQEGELVKAREAAELDYFRRKIDEPTFRTIMTEKHAEILRVREVLKLKHRERSELVLRKLSPIALAKWLASIPRNLLHALGELAWKLHLFVLKLKLRRI